MRGLTLLSLVTLAVSAPQGYNYPVMQYQHQPHLEYGPAPSPSTSLDFFKNLKTVMALQAASVENSESYASNSIEQYPTTSRQQTNPSSQTQQRLPQNFVASNSLYTSYEPATNHYTQQQPIISKRFFLHSAPEEEESEIEYKHITLGKARKNLNVVFIRAPAKAAQRTALKISPAVNEDKTVIYVLAKKQDASDIDAHVIEPITTTARPEVYFIKYRTHEEAEHAQRAIQSQYDALGGSTLISNEGVAPVSSVIGSLDTGKHAEEDEAQYAAADAAQQQQQQAVEEFVGVQAYPSQQSYTEEEASTNNGYLPPTVRKY